MYTEKQIEEMIEAHEKLVSRIDHICTIMHAIDKDAPYGYDPSDDKMEIGSYVIEINWETEVGCMGHYETDYHGYSIPTEYLWMSDDDIRAATTEKVREREAEEARKKAEQAADKAARKERADYEKYKELQRRFG